VRDARDPGIDDHLSELRNREGRDHADRGLPVLLRLQRLRCALASKARRLLCILLIWIGVLPAGSRAGKLLRVNGHRSWAKKNALEKVANVTSNVERYRRIAPVYDLFDLPFERRRYRALRPLLFRGMAGRLLDAGVGTGRNCEFYPPSAVVCGIDTSPAMLARAQDRCPTLAAGGRLYQMDVTALEFPASSFDAAVASFLFCVLPDQLQVPALRELRRVVKPGGLIRLLEYVRPQGTLRRFASNIWQPWIRWAYGASFDRHTERHVPAAGLELLESRYVVDDRLKLLTARVPYSEAV
jgi:ubiquinone/menaquinone biosynthesis C-methylase UbiE